MRRVQLAAAAITVFIVAGAMLGGRALAAQVGLSASFPASRIQLDPAPVTLNMPGPTAMTAMVVDWRGAPVAGVPVSFAVLSGPNKGKALPSATTNSKGRAGVSYSNAGEPGSDTVQARFKDGLEIHRSNRHFVYWLSGPPATAIKSPASIAVTPSCFQPLGAAAVTSNSFAAPAPVTTPRPARAAASPPAPKPEKGAMTVSGENFNPLSAVLITFDAGLGGNPQSFEAQTDPFGHFSRRIEVVEPGDGLHLIRVDDFRQREADFANYLIPCYQPSLALNPPIGPPGFVTLAVGTGFPANSPITFLNWDARLLSPLPKNLKTDANGGFQVPVLILYHDRLGPRMLTAVVPNDKGEGSGAANIVSQAPFMVTPGRTQPSDFVLRR
jgi:hypothetical protein